MRPRPATTRPRIAAGPIAERAIPAMLPIAPVIEPRMDRPLLAAVPNIPVRPVVLPARTPTRPPKFVKTLPKTLPKTAALAPMPPSNTPTLPRPASRGIIVAIALLGFNKAQAAIALGPISANLLLIFSIVCSDN